MDRRLKRLWHHVLNDAFLREKAAPLAGMVEPSESACDMKICNKYTLKD